MKKSAIIYGSFLAVLLILLRVLEYRFFIRDLSQEIYIAVIALFFTMFGLWLGHKLISRKKEVIYKTKPLEIDQDAIKKIGISKRELEVLQHMSRGLSNQEIADTLYVSLNTIKTHISNLYSKLNVDRRTQAVQKAQELNLLL
ncbi:MAG: DNA-binding response regulator [Calditrichaeota bacterium]|nr:MAG: DNA-binding response regulator [Calditrichota bacterium]MBL1205791.1 DNA-binding response regulator [Calditrichota bacterium]NOG45619.1 DNA-binding response regulator [Calditrichota bacterium]